MFSIDLSPLRTNPNFRWLYMGQLISFFGSMITYVAIPFQMYEITKSTFHVGMLGIIQLVPLVLFGVWGGALADSSARRKLVIMTEASLAAGNLALMAFTLSGSKNFYFLYALAALMTVFKGLERPAIEALTQQLVKKQDIPKVSTLQSFKSTAGMIMGPAIGGILISNLGIVATYGVDLLTYVASIFCLCKLVDIPPLKEKRKADLASIAEGFRYAFKRPDLLGTYLVDMVAMTLAYPNPLFPALASSLGDTGKLGWLYSAPAVGAFLATVTSSWTHRAVHHGKLITLGALVWCLGIIGFGWTGSFPLALVFLGVAGFADMISGIFRSTMWNETIPEEFRGRLASVEMISYASGPLLGNTFMGTLSEEMGVPNALMLGGTTGTLAVLALGLSIRSFWLYRANR